MRRTALVCLAVVAIGACGGAREVRPPDDVAARPERTRSHRAAPTSKAADDGRRAPDFEITTFEGDKFSLADQKGTPVVLNFWESW